MTLLAQNGAAAARWQLETHWTWAPWVTTVVIAALVLLVVWLYRTEITPAGRWYRSLLVVLRLTSLAIVLLMLSELVLTSTQLGEPRLEILVDRSPSMAEDDVAADGQPSTRFAAAKQFWLDGDGGRIAQLGQRYDLSVTAVSGAIQPLAGDDLAIELDALQLDDGESRTRLGDAILAAASPRMTAAPAAVVALTDGQTTAGRSLEQAAAIARRRGVPLYLVGLGSTQRPADVALADVIADPVVFADDLATVQATISATSVAGQSATVRLEHADTGETLAEQSIAISGDQVDLPVTLVLEPKEAGELPLRLIVDRVAEEEDVENNEVALSINVTDEPVRVLLAAGYPSYEFRFLKTMLDRDTKFAAATYLQEADLDYARQDRTAIAQLPLSIEQFAQFDVIVLLDLDPTLLPPLVWQSLETFVAERGGGLLLSAGSRSFPWKYRDNESIVRLVPIDISDVDGGGFVDDGFRPAWSELAQRLANLQLDRAAEESEAVWKQLAPHYWYAEAGPTKPAAQLLATHPTQKTPRGEAIPIVAMQYFGAGRVWYQGIDDTWRWRLRLGDVFFARYWGQTLRLLARGKMLSDAAGAQLIVERREYHPGEVVRVTLRAGGDSAARLSTAAPVVAIESPGRATQRVALDRQAATGRYAAQLRDLPPGRYRGFLVEPALSPAPAAIDFEIIAPPGELTDVTLNRAALQAAATTTIGKYYDLSDAETLLNDLPIGEQIAREAAPPVELWNKWWMLATLATCLSLEWILRKRKAML